MTVVFFMSLAPGRVLGAEFAAIFAIFTSQAWNMAFSFYQSLRTIPTELIEAAESFRLSPWMRFWQLEVPFGMPALIWNMMMSMSGGWFFVVASEAISVGHTTVALPGVGSYIALAIADKNLPAIGWAIATMLIVILLYDQLLFRSPGRLGGSIPVAGAGTRCTCAGILGAHRRCAARASSPLATLAFHAAVLWTSRAVKRTGSVAVQEAPRKRRSLDLLWVLLIVAAVVLGLWHIVWVLIKNTPLSEALQVCGLAFLTMLRVFVLIALASLVWVPIGVWVGMRPRVSQFVQPIAQFMAAFPANLLFPIAVYGIVSWKLNADIFLSPLMILRGHGDRIPVQRDRRGFLDSRRNALRGRQFPGHRMAAMVAQSGRCRRYYRSMSRAPLPLPGGSWNTAIVAEFGDLGRHHRTGAALWDPYIAEAATAGDFHRIVLGIGTMQACLWSSSTDLFWRPLYYYAERKYRLT